MVSETRGVGDFRLLICTCVNKYLHNLTCTHTHTYLSHDHNTTKVVLLRSQDIKSTTYHPLICSDAQ